MKQEESTKKKLLEKTLRSRNFLHFAICATINTGFLVYFVAKCEIGETFDHLSAANHVNVWANNLALFAGIFLLGESSKAGVKIIQAKWGNSNQPPQPPVSE